MAARSLRAHLLRMLLPPVAALLVLGGLVAYYPSIEPATEAYDQALVDVGIAVGTYIRPSASGGYAFDLPLPVEQALRTDRYDTIYYRVLGPSGLNIAGDAALPAPENQQQAAYDAAVTDAVCGVSDRSPSTTRPLVISRPSASRSSP